MTLDNEGLRQQLQKVQQELVNLKKDCLEHDEDGPDEDGPPPDPIIKETNLTFLQNNLDNQDLLKWINEERSEKLGIRQINENDIAFFRLEKAGVDADKIETVQQILESNRRNPPDQSAHGFPGGPGGFELKHIRNDNQATSLKNIIDQNMNEKDIIEYFWMIAIARFMNNQEFHECFKKIPIKNKEMLAKRMVADRWTFTDMSRLQKFQRNYLFKPEHQGAKEFDHKLVNDIMTTMNSYRANNNTRRFSGGGSWPWVTAGLVMVALGSAMTTL